MQHDANDLISLFNAHFELTENTILRGGAEEPFYQAPRNLEPHPCSAIIFFREDYFSSALHEISHWCIAGIDRRKQDDYGYWYSPDGRDGEEQKLFEQVEIKPQAIEWLFSIACNKPFQVSVDNLQGSLHASADFKQAIRAQLYSYLIDNDKLPNRAHTFLLVLLTHFSTTLPTTSDMADYQI